MGRMGASPRLLSEPYLAVVRKTLREFPIRRPSPLSSTHGPRERRLRQDARELMRLS